MLGKFFDWCIQKNEENLPSEKTRRAITYALNQKASLMRVLDDPRLELTNNAAERAIRPVTVGRKNWLFCDSERGAHATAVLYSILNTAKMNCILSRSLIKRSGFFFLLTLRISFCWALLYSSITSDIRIRASFFPLFLSRPRDTHLMVRFPLWTYRFNST